MLATPREAEAAAGSKVRVFTVLKTLAVCVGGTVILATTCPSGGASYRTCSTTGTELKAWTGWPVSVASVDVGVLSSWLLTAWAAESSGKRMRELIVKELICSPRARAARVVLATKAAEALESTARPSTTPPSRRREVRTASDT